MLPGTRWTRSPQAGAVTRKYIVAETFDLDGGCFVLEASANDAAGDDDAARTFIITKFDSEHTRAIVQCKSTHERDRWLVDVRQQQARHHVVTSSRLTDARTGRLAESARSVTAHSDDVSSNGDIGSISRVRRVLCALCH
jgi:hypothetical protein